MKKFLFLILAFVAFLSCKNNTTDAVKNTEEKKEFKVTPQLEETAVIYEANIRQYSNKGTFDEFTKDIPQLKDLGVKIIWLMPVFPISETKRKAKGDLFVSEIKDKEERKKYLGSYYAVSDFRKVNPEFGNLSDLRKLIKTAHQNNIAVILDWVPNHTGWDHPWIKNHPDFYTKNDKGEITDPLNDDGTSKGWTDVADLNYDNKELRKAMISDMQYWLKNENIDGFRCDVAGSVPLSFWQEAIPQLRKEKDIFMLAEAWEPELLKDHLFDMAYAWEGHHIINEIAKGKKLVSDWDNYIKKVDTVYEKDDILMNFITNHDENSWNGTANKRLGKAKNALLALTYLTPGMPLIYSGQEYGLNHRLKFFEKDSIPKTKGKDWELLQKLVKLKNNNDALNGGKQKASYVRIPTSNDKKILAFKRFKNKDTVVYLANLSKDTVKFTMNLKGKFKDYVNNKKVVFKKDEVFIFYPWENKILIK
jgi:glycosidase